MTERGHHYDPIAATRRTFLKGGLGLGAIALSEACLGQERASLGGAAPPAVRRPPRVKRVIHLAMSGAPPHLDLFDPKSKLTELDGTDCPASLLEGKRLAFIQGVPRLLGSPYPTVTSGALGIEHSSLLEHFESYAADVCLVRSMHTDQFNHAPADLMLYTGSNTVGKPSVGAWAAWGLGTLNRDLPAYVTLVSGGSDPTGGNACWGAGFLPAEHQGVRLRSMGDPVLYVSDPAGLGRPMRRRMLDALREANEEERRATGDPEVDARIAQYELAFRMQTSVPEVMDISSESPETLEAYGAVPGKASFANNCLLARRLAESGVRYLQLHDWGWDLHGTSAGDDLLEAFPRKVREIDRPTAALMRDLKRTGLLDETLVVWGGEFGRTPMNEARGGSTFLGRDHQPDAFTMWLAGGGVKAGHVHGATDDLGASVTEGHVSVRDLHATVLHLLGLDPHELRFPFQGLEHRLIGPAHGPEVARALLV